MWTDSSIVSSWIRGDPNRWAPFVCNRIHKILATTEIEQWNLVVSQDNPADCNSRGLSITQLRDSNLWWTGPNWLSLPSNEWPTSPFNLVDDHTDELRSKYKLVNAVTNEVFHIDSIVQRFTSFIRLRNCFAYVFRYMQILRERSKSKVMKLSVSNQPVHSQIEKLSPPSVTEINYAELALLRLIQREHFDAEIQALNQNKVIPKSSKIRRLTPFIDSNHILRVNGRLRNAFMTYDEKYPIIVPSNHRIVHLIVDFYHNQTLHGGPQLTVNQIRQLYWIPNIRAFARHFIHKCIRCFKNRPIL